MNPRIRELAEQAGYTPLPGFDFANELQEVFLKNFAQLIVRQCAGIALKSGSVTNKSEVAVAEADRIYHKIKEHFGVEE